MNPGDLVKFIRPTASQAGKVFLITEIEDGRWVGIDDNPSGSRLLHHIRDLILVNGA